MAHSGNADAQDATLAGFSSLDKLFEVGILLVSS
jgi:hypothetical protein